MIDDANSGQENVYNRITYMHICVYMCVCVWGFGFIWMILVIIVMMGK